MSGIVSPADVDVVAASGLLTSLMLTYCVAIPVNRSTE